jgi:hypothetical protein
MACFDLMGNLLAKVPWSSSKLAYPSACIQPVKFWRCSTGRPARTVK